MMAAADLRPSGGFSPVAVVWCRQVDNEAESPGYTTIPEEFPGRRETLETIRLVGNLTVNVADTHDYWDPDPSQTLSYYPNLFLYPAGNGRYTCVGRMFLSTEDRPRLGMKTLVLETSQLVAGGEFGATVLQAWASMGGRPGADRPRLEPEPSVYQAVGEGFLFHRGTTEPVVIVAAEQWDSAIEAVGELVRLMPTSLIALGAFLVFPYFLPEGKVNLHEFSEQVPLALALMRVPERESMGDRHAKRIQSWEAAPVSLRDLTKPVNPRAKDPLPLVLQYVRDHAEEKISEVSRRVDLVEAGRLRGHLEDPDRQAGRDRRKEMWRIGTAMESAALLLARPRGRSVPMTGEAAKRASQYLQAQPPPDGAGSAALERPSPSPLAASEPSMVAGSNQLPPWLQRSAEVSVPPPGPIAVPMSVSDDPSSLPAGAAAPAPLDAPDASRPAGPAIAGIVATGGISSSESEARLRSYVDQRIRELVATIPPAPDPKAMDARLAGVATEAESRATAILERRLREIGELEAKKLETIQANLSARIAGVSTDAEAQATLTLERRLSEVAERDAKTLETIQANLSTRLAAVEARPVLPPSAIRDEVSNLLAQSVDPKLADLSEKSRLAVKASADATLFQLREEIAESVGEIQARATRSEEELRVALVAQLDLELQEAKEHGGALREEIEGRVRDLMKERLAEVEQRRVREVRELEQRLGLLLDGRAKDLEARLAATATEQRAKILQAEQEQIAQAERRLGLASEARLTRAVETQTQSVAGLQVRLQSYFDQRLREDQEREREKYTQLLARFKTEVDQGLAHMTDSSAFDAAVRTRIAQTLESARVADQATLDARVAEVGAHLQAQHETATTRLAQVETRIQQRETEISQVEKQVRRDIEELDRRLQVMSDRMVPLVRNTWLKVDELQKAGGPSAAADARLKEFRREFGRELRRVEGEMLEQTTELRDRMEGAIAHQGRIWLNFVRQMAESDDDLGSSATDPAARSLRRVNHAATAAAASDPRIAPIRSRATFGPFDEDPVNPLAPQAVPDEPVEPEPVERRRARRTT
jgi:hypothetical protein